MKRIHQVNISELTARFEFPANAKLVGMYIAAVGTNQSGQQLAVGNLGQVQILKNGDQVSLFDFDKMHYLNNILGGAPANVSNIGGSFHLSSFVPFGFNDLENALFSSNDRWEVIHNFPNATGTIVASGTLRYFGLVADDSAIQRFLTKYYNNDYSFAAAATLSDRLKHDNVRAILVENNTNLSSLTLTKDSKPFVEMIDRQDLVAMSQTIYKIETYSATTPYFLIDLNPNGEEIGSLSDEVKLDIVVSAGTTLKMLVICQDLTPVALRESYDTRQAHVNRVAEQKAVKGLERVASYAKTQA